MWTETKSVRQHFKHDIKRQPFYVSFILKNSYGRTVLVKNYFMYKYIHRGEGF